MTRYRRTHTEDHLMLMFIGSIGVLAGCGSALSRYFSGGIDSPSGGIIFGFACGVILTNLYLVRRHYRAGVITAATRIPKILALPILLFPEAHRLQTEREARVFRARLAQAPSQAFVTLCEHLNVNQIITLTRYGFFECQAPSGTYYRVTPNPTNGVQEIAYPGGYIQRYLCAHPLNVGTEFPYYDYMLASYLFLLANEKGYRSIANGSTSRNDFLHRQQMTDEEYFGSYRLRGHGILAIVSEPIPDGLTKKEEIAAWLIERVFHMLPAPALQLH